MGPGVPFPLQFIPPFSISFTSCYRGFEELDYLSLDEERVKLKREVYEIIVHGIQVHKGFVQFTLFLHICLPSFASVLFSRFTERAKHMKFGKMDFQFY
jgi:hypothetical protein